PDSFVASPSWLGSSISGNRSPGLRFSRMEGLHCCLSSLRDHANLKPASALGAELLPTSKSNGSSPNRQRPERCSLVWSGTSRRLWNLLEDPVHEVGFRLLDPKPLELRRDLPPVVGGVIDDMAQHCPRGQGPRTAAPRIRDGRGEPLGRESRQQLVEPPIRTLQQAFGIVHRRQLHFCREALIRIVR